MSVFENLEKTAQVFHPNDSDTTKKTSYPAVADFTIKLNIQRLNAKDEMLEGEIYGTHYCYAKGTHADEIKKGDKVVCDGVTSYVSDHPRTLALMKGEILIYLNAELE